MTSRVSSGALRPRPHARIGSLCWLALLGCSVGQGEGFVRSDNLFVDNCWEGTLDLKPNFFAANPFADTLTIRVQRGEQEIQVSDGFVMLVNDVTEIRASHLGTSLPLGLPLAVTPLGYPLPEVPVPPAASMSLYFNNSCRGQNAELMAVGGTVRFERLFSGDANEENAEDRLTEGSFEALMADPRDAIPRPAGAEGPPFTYPDDRTSLVTAEFSFVFHRGTPAQPFP
jgi:hypothetical protein